MLYSYMKKLVTKMIVLSVYHVSQLLPQSIAFCIVDLSCSIFSTRFNTFIHGMVTTPITRDKQT